MPTSSEPTLEVAERADVVARAIVRAVLAEGEGDERTASDAVRDILAAREAAAYDRGYADGLAEGGMDR